MQRAFALRMNLARLVFLTSQALHVIGTRRARQEWALPLSSNNNRAHDEWVV